MRRVAGTSCIAIERAIRFDATTARTRTNGAADVVQVDVITVVIGIEIEGTGRDGLCQQDLARLVLQALTAHDGLWWQVASGRERLQRLRAGPRRRGVVFSPFLFVVVAVVVPKGRAVADE